MAHILSEVQRLCNRVAIIREGEIVTVEDIKTLRHNNYKKISISGENLDTNAFNIEGATNPIQEDGTFSFFFKGNINQVTKLISSQTITDVLIEEPTLEEIFMHYYA